MVMTEHLYAKGEQRNKIIESGMISRNQSCVTLRKVNHQAGNIRQLELTFKLIKR